MQGMLMFRIHYQKCTAMKKVVFSRRGATTEIDQVLPSSQKIHTCEEGRRLHFASLPLLEHGVQHPPNLLVAGRQGSPSSQKILTCDEDRRLHSASLPCCSMECNSLRIFCRHILLT